MKLFVSDIDGTLIRSNGKLSSFASQALIELLESGVKFSVASSRSVAAIRQVLGSLPLELPVISFNGAFISDFHSDERYLIRSINPEFAYEIEQMACDLGLRANVSTYEEEDRLYVNEIVNDGMAWYLRDRLAVGDSRLQEGFDREHIFKQKMTCLNIIGEYERLAELRMGLINGYSGRLQLHLFENIYSPGWHWLTIHDHHATKGNACIELCKMSGIALQDLTVFGDHLNDVEMFKVAGRAIAVKNAQAELKNIANRVIGHHDEDSVVRYIYSQTLEK